MPQLKSSSTIGKVNTLYILLLFFPRLYEPRYHENAAGGHQSSSSLGVVANPLGREELASFCLPPESFCKSGPNCKDFFS